MNKQKKYIMGLVISIITLLSGISYAYFTATFQNLGVRETSISTETLGNLKLTGETVFTSENLYPGEMGVQEFSIEPVSQGKGIYELDLNAVVPSEFGGDIFITLYRATSNEASVTVAKGELTQEGDNYYKQDTLSTSNVEIIYPASSLTNNSQIVLFQTEFDETLTNTKYYLVYDYRNRENQNSQMGKTFSATISGRLVKALNGAGVIAKLAGNASRNSTTIIDNGTDETGCTNTLAYDDFGNLRYVGDNPCNYVTFNDETPGMYDEYQYYVDNYAMNSYDTLEDCELKKSKPSSIDLFSNVSMECVLNDQTNKYDLYINGFFSSFGTFKSKAECDTSQFIGIFAENIPGTCEKTGKKLYPGGWRMIGVVDGKLKVIYNDSIGDYSWDTSASSINKGWGINQWGESGDYTGADLMKLLNPGYENNLAEDANGDLIEGTYANNSLYWNRTAGNCYNKTSNAMSECDFTSNGLTNASKNMIEEHNWYLGHTNTTNLGIGTNVVSDIYESEKGILGKSCEISDDCNDVVTRKPLWNGKVGLVNVSDILYSIGGTNRNTCLNSTNLTEEESMACYSKLWINGGYSALEPGMKIGVSLNSTTDASSAIAYGIAFGTANVSGTRVSMSIPVQPVVYLKSNVSITGGEGTPTNPYVLSLN